MLMRKVILMLALGLTCSSAMAEWTIAGNSNSKVETLFADKTTIREAGNYIIMMDMVNFEETQLADDDEEYFSITTKREYDCQDGRVRQVAYVSYEDKMGKGNIVEAKDHVGNFKKIDPHSMSASLFKIACGKH